MYIDFYVGNIDKLEQVFPTEVAEAKQLFGDPNPRQVRIRGEVFVLHEQNKTYFCRSFGDCLEEPSYLASWGLTVEVVAVCYSGEFNKSTSLVDGQYEATDAMITVEKVFGGEAEFQGAPYHLRVTSFAKKLQPARDFLSRIMDESGLSHELAESRHN